MRLYRALLHCYSASFRVEYGEEMCAVFRQRRRDATDPLAIVWLWIATFFETLANAFLVHADILRQDLHYAGRTLGRSPGFAATAVIVTALGIGATTAAFTMVDHVLIRPLPFPDEDRLVKLYQTHVTRGVRFWDISPANYRDWKEASHSFESMGSFRGLLVTMVGSGDPQQVVGASFTSEIFPVLGVRPALGRYFGEADDRETAPATVVLSFDFWQNQFGADEGVVGRKLILDGRPYEVIGVMPKGFYFPSRNERLWTAMRFAPKEFEDRGNTFLFGLAKLKRGTSLDQALAELSVITNRLGTAYPKDLAHVGANAILLHDEVSDQTRTMLIALLAAAGCVLLIACTNLANLLLSRAMVRRKELAVRAALGAGPERLARQLLTESLLLALAGGGLGILIARVSLPLLMRLAPSSLPAGVPSIDVRILGFAMLLTCATGLAFGALPAWQSARRRDAGGLRDSARSGGGRRERVRGALVIAEVTGCVVLLVSCGLLTRALWKLRSVDPGFRPENVLTLRTALPMPKYERLTAREQFYARVLADVRRLPGVTGAAYTSFLPFIHGGGVMPVDIPGQSTELSERDNASLRFVTPGYFSVMGIPLLQGRDVAEPDTLLTPRVAVVSASFVRRYWPAQNPIGRRFHFAMQDRIVVGVAGDVRVRGLERPSEPQVYLPYKQQPDEVMVWYAPKDLVLRAGSDPSQYAPVLRRIIHGVDTEQPVSDVRLYTQVVESGTATRGVQAGALGAFAGVALLLAAIGIHGLLAFAVSTRVAEIGVRMALGARRSDILKMVVRDGIVLAGIGTAAGIVLAYAAGLQMRSLLVGIRPDDAVTFLAASGLALLMTLVGSFVPALRAVRVDPTIAMRSE